MRALPTQGGKEVQVGSKLMSLPVEVKFSDQAEADAFLSSLDANVIGGLDEVGRGPFAGPVVAACVVLPSNHGIVGIRDSKKLSAKRREELAAQIMDKGWWEISTIESAVIDKINIREATLNAAANAAFCYSIHSDNRLHIDFLLCDGGLHLRDRTGYPTISVVKGDLWFECIGAASIVAKVYRDAQMLVYHEVWPEYGFDTNQGYGTKFHIEAIKKYGLTSIHRRSFKPIRNYLKSRSKCIYALPKR